MKCNSREPLLNCLFLYVIALLLTPLCLRADKTFAWAGTDTRFSGWFSISDADYDNRSFQTITHARFEFIDSQNPARSVVLDDPRGFYPNNTMGRLTPDGLSLLHGTHPDNPNVSFWVAVWQPGGIDVGMYGHHSGGLGKFTYANYRVNFTAESTGHWALVPEPSVLSMALVACAFFFLYKKPQLG